MAGIQVGGIVSGLDTNSIVDQMTKAANVSVDRLNGDYSYKSLEYDLYSEVDDMMSDMSSSLLTLRLSSTFNTKTTSSTNTSVATATATTDADVGSFSLLVKQLAKNSEATSSLTKVSMVKSGANVTKISGYANESIEGTHTNTVSTTSGGKYLSSDSFVVDNLGTVQKQSGTSYSNVSTSGNLVADVSGSLTFSYTDNNGDAQTLTITGDFGEAGNDINVVSTNIQDTLNGALNASLGTTSVTYAAVRADYNSTSGAWSFALYETTIDDHNIAFAGTDDATLRNELGFSASSTPTTSNASAIMKYHIADTASDLSNKMASSISGIIPGASLTLSTTLTTGTFIYAQDASLKISSATKSTYTSGDVSTGTVDLTTKGLQNAGFSYSASTALNGTFTINDVAITIDDYTKISATDLMGIINSSGAGVTATFDETTQKFTLTANDAGSSSISLGDYSDTSSILKFMRLDSSSSTTSTTGSTSGSISTTSELTNSGLTTYPTTGTFTINGVSIYVDTATESLEDVIEKVNNSGAGVTMSYDSGSDKIKLKSNSIEPIKVGSSKDSSNLLVAFNLIADKAVETTIGSVGQKAVFQVDGDTYIRDTNTIDDVVAGVTMTLNSATDEATTISVAVDTSKGVAAFAKFIQYYNTLMDKLNVPEKDDDEDEYTEYLTDSDKESMSEDDIATYQEYYELYNSYDIIRKSSELRNLDTEFRKAVFAVRPGITSSINDMSDLGIEVAGAGDIDTEVYGYLVTLSTDYDTIVAALEENETFMTALTEKPKDVHKFFANSSDLDVDDAETDAEAVAIERQIENEAGWARYFDDYILERYTGTDGFVGSKIGSTGTIQSALDKLEKRISTQEDRVEMELERYWAQFSAMEEAIAEAQSQAAAITGSSSSSS